MAVLFIVVLLYADCYPPFQQNELLIYVYIQFVLSLHPLWNRNILCYLLTKLEYTAFR
jgi:hypothetical protein